MQFVLDPYACAMYIVSYISKSQRGMSNLMHAAVKEAKSGNMDIKRQVRHVGNVFSNSVEVSAQEAVYLVLQMPLTRSTRDVVFLNTSLAGKRVNLLKSKESLEALPAESTDVIADNLINRYSKRPKCIEHYCLADYAAELDIKYPKDRSSERYDEEVNDDDIAESEVEKFEDDQTIMKLKSVITIKRRKSKKVIRYVRFSKKDDKENHYREKLLLFHPWRNEQSDLLGDYDTFEAHNLQLKKFIDFKVQQYEHHVEELEQARELAEKDYNAYDDVAPGAQEQESEALQEEPVESEEFLFFNPDKVAGPREYDIGIELGSGHVSAATIEQTENILSDEDYLSLLRSLNQKQRQFYNHVIHWMKTKDEPIYAFLTGGAGVGKSVVIRCLYQTLYRMLNLKEGEDPDDKRILLCAFTGKAAYNINGSTISSAFMEKFKQSNQTLGCDQLNTFRSKYRSLSVVIIDEISMVSNNKLSFIDQRLQQLTGRRIPFGGISIIAVGDLFQLKPVADTWIFQDLSRDASALSPNLWKEHFKMFELTEIMRQKDDFEFAQMLNRLRIHKLTEQDQKAIADCTVKPDSESYPKTAPHIFAENTFMHSFNDKMMMSFNAPKVSIECHDSVVGDNISAIKREQILNRVRSLDVSNTMGLQLSVTIVLGMLYDLTINLDTEDGLNNGSPCIAKFIEYKQSETSRPSIIWVRFEDDKCGKNRRNKYKKKGFYHDAIDQTWTPIFDVERTFFSLRNNIKRIQFPLQTSAGKTVYRAQGTTVNELVIDLSQRKTRKIPHLHYVALSRVRSMKNLYIVNFNEKALMVDENVVQEMQRLGESRLQLCYVPLCELQLHNRFTIIFNNCRSLHKHFEDISVDPNVRSGDVVAVAESRLHGTDSSRQYLIDGFHLLRNDQKQNKPGVRPPHGLAVYIKDDIIINQCFPYNTADIEFTFLDVRKHSKDKQIVVLYKSPSCSFRSFETVVTRELSK